MSLLPLLNWAGTSSVKGKRDPSQLISECDCIKKGDVFAACHTEILQHLCLLLRSCQRHGSLAPLDCCRKNVSSKGLMQNKRDGKQDERNESN